MEHFREWCFTRWVLYKQDGEGAKFLDPTLWFRSLSPIFRRSKHLEDRCSRNHSEEEFFISTSLKKSLENIDRDPGLEAAQIPSCGGREWTLSPFLWDKEKTNLPTILWIQSILLWSSSWSHEWGADFHLHTPHCYPLTLIKLHFYTGARRKNRLFLSGTTDFFSISILANKL